MLIQSSRVNVLIHPLSVNMLIQTSRVNGLIHPLSVNMLIQSSRVNMLIHPLSVNMLIQTSRVNVLIHPLSVNMLIQSSRVNVLIHPLSVNMLIQTSPVNVLIHPLSVDMLIQTSRVNVLIHPLSVNMLIQSSRVNVLIHPLSVNMLIQTSPVNVLIHPLSVNMLIQTSRVNVLIHPLSVNMLIQSSRVNVLIHPLSVNMLIQSSRVNMLIHPLSVNMLIQTSRVNVLIHPLSVNMLIQSSRVNVLIHPLSVNMLIQTSPVNVLIHPLSVDMLIQTSRVNVLIHPLSVNMLIQSSRVNMLIQSSRVNMLIHPLSVNMLIQTSRVNVLIHPLSVNMLIQSSRVNVLIHPLSVNMLIQSSRVNMLIQSSCVNMLIHPLSVNMLIQTSPVNVLIHPLSVNMLIQSSRVNMLIHPLSVNMLIQTSPVNVLIHPLSVNMLIQSSRVNMLIHPLSVNMLIQTSPVNVLIHPLSVNMLIQSSRVNMLIHPLSVFWFQDWNLTWYTSQPDLTQCFQHTVLLQGLSLASIGLGEMFFLLVTKNEEIQKHSLIVIGPLIRSLTLVLAVVILHVERMKGCRSSFLLFLFWALMVLCSLVPLKVNIEQIIDRGFSSDSSRLLVFFICFFLQLIQLVLSCFCDLRPLSAKLSYVQNRCPEEDASFLSNFFFFWFSGLVVRGYRRPLQAADLWPLQHQDSAIQIMTDLENFWAQNCLRLQKEPDSGELTQNWTQSPTSSGSWSRDVDAVTENTRLLKKKDQEKKKKKGRGYGILLLLTMGWSLGPYFLCGTLCLLLHEVFMFAVPQVLSLLLGFMSDEDAAMWKGFLFCSLLFLLSCLQSLLHHQYMFHCFRVGMRLKTALIGLVYRKCLLLSSGARRRCDLGEIMNLVSADTQKLMDFVVHFNSLWMSPIEITLCFYFLWQLLGPPALAGIVTVVVIFPLNGLIAKMRSKLQEVQMKFTDSRLKLMNEILSGVKILKFYAWEEAFLRRVGVLREGELETLKTSQVLHSISLASFNSSSFLITLSVFTVYVTTDDRNLLDAQKIFVSVALINILKTPLSQLPFAMSAAMQALVSLRRLGNFLSQDELKADSVERLPRSSDGDAVRIEDGSFSWTCDGPPCLQGISVKMKPGSLVAVVGHVGSGKSSLLSAMLGEMERRSGLISVKGSVAYVPQQAWIQNASVKDNILFGREKKERWYHRVLEACALLPDLEILPAGDGTEIGEKTRVLVTHSLSFLSKADLILVMFEGHISEMGSYMDLMERKGNFAKFIHAFNTKRRRGSCASTGSSAPRGKSKTCMSAGSRKSLSRLTESSIDIPQKQLISCDMNSATEVINQDLDAGKLMNKIPTGRVKLQMYRDYFGTVGPTIIATIIFLCAFQQAASLAYSYWLSLWADAPPLNRTRSSHQLRLAVFAALGLTQSAAMFGTTLAIALGGIVASRHLHADLLLGVLRLPVSFFEATPSGNLLNCFSKEVDAIDCMIPEGLKTMLGYLFKLLEVCVILLLATPLTGLVLLPLTCVYAFIQSFYVASSCQLRRLEAVSREPLYSHLNETVQGAAVVRAFGDQCRFVVEADRHVDHNQEAYFPRFVATRWLAVNLEFLGNLLVLAASVLSVRGRDHLSPGIVGLAVTHSLQVTGILSWIVRSWTDVENNIVSVERVKEYDSTEKEEAWALEGTKLPTDWPETGNLQFEDYGLRYRKDLDLALHSICINIQAREKVGIVGRTGAGKSSLALGIFRILEAANGQIFIDGINIAEIGLHDLRSRITIIPQDPVLFSGSLRMNLDPFDVCSDEDLWKALELAHLSSFVSMLPQKLNHQCCEGGENLSLGQRQLLCLARALLRKTRILVLDEATAAVDLETDQLIQSTIRIQFNNCTVLTIAHRLNTIMDYNRVIVMDRGHIAEIDSPSELIRLRGFFYQMCAEAGLV
ncbi:multidrug resistance-associated protein 1-like isoform 3-T3 [Spinachia spinachia]